MKSFIRTKVIAIALVGIIMGTWAASAQASREAISTDTANSNSFRSAFLGPDVWEANLSSIEIKLQLQEHFAQVIQRLESNNATSLLRALIRAEASSNHRWTKAQRRAALISLAANRQRQIAHLRYYMNRGLFPQNEGQSISAVPIFVDRHQTHCAVGFLMHCAGRNSDVASIVETNNLVRVNDVRRGSMLHWIRSSGLTQEEAALIQPGYPLDEITTFDEFSVSNATIQENGFVVSEATFRSHSFNTALTPDSPISPDALQAIFELGQSGIQDNGFEATTGAGFLFGSQFDDVDPAQLPFGSWLPSAPANLDESLYIGTNDGISFDVGEFFTGNNATIFEFEYLLRSEQGDFSQIALTTFGGTSFYNFDPAAGLIHTQIFDGDTSALLGEAQLSAIDEDGLGGAIGGTESVQLATDFVRIRTQNLVVGTGGFTHFFHEFETSAVPEPSTGSTMILLGAFAAIKRRRRALSS